MGFSDALPRKGPFQEMGLDSFMAAKLRNRLATATGLRLHATFLFDHPTAQALAGALERRLFAMETPSPPPILAEIDRFEHALSALEATDAERKTVTLRLQELVSKWLARQATPEHSDLVEKLSSTTDDDELFRLIDQVRSG